MDVIWSAEHGPDGEIVFGSGDTVLRWTPSNGWAVPVGDVPAEVWPQLPAVGGLTLDGDPLPAIKPACPLPFPRRSPRR